MGYSLGMPSLTELAHEGARVRLEELKAEINALYRTFPRLKFVRKAAPILKKVAKIAGPIVGRSKGRKGGSRSWTAAQRKAQARKMRAYWANRKANGKTRSPTGKSNRHVKR